MERALSSSKPETAVRRRDHDGRRLALCVTALVLLGGLASPLHRAVARSGKSTAEIDGAGWEGRRLIAQLLWAKTHSVLHAGVEEREARPGEQHSRSEFHSAGSSGGSENHSEHHENDGHDHGAHSGASGHEGGHVLVIPPAREDFRGVLGDLERQVKPYLGRDGRSFSKDWTQTLPFYRLMTWADPHFVQGYTVGAAFVSDAGEKADEGIRFLQEGARFNPESFEIQTELGHYFLVYKKDYPAAIRHLEQALRLVPTGRKLAELEEEALVDAYRWLALAYTEAGRARDALALAQRGLRILPRDVTLRNVIAQQGRPRKPGS